MINLRNQAKVVTLLMTGLISNDAWAFKSQAPRVPVVESPQKPLPVVPQPPTLRDFQSLYLEVEEDLRHINEMISNGNYKEARLRALTAYRKTGIEDPQTTEQIIMIPFENLSNSDLTTKLSLINPTRRNALKKAAREYQGGSFLNLVNYAKRAKFLQIQAEYYMLTQMGHFTPSMIEQTRNQMLAVYNIEIFFTNGQLKEPYMAFDTDVSSDDQRKFFNLELEIFMEKAPQWNLPISQFMNVVEQNKETRLAAYHTDVLRSFESLPAKARAEPEPKFQVETQCRAALMNANMHNSHVDDRMKWFSTLAECFVYRDCYAGFMASNAHSSTAITRCDVHLKPAGR